MTPEYKAPEPIEVFDSDTDGDDEISQTSCQSKLGRKRKAVESLYDDYTTESDTESDPTFNPDEIDQPKKKKGETKILLNSK